MADAPRSGAQRKADTIAKLEATEADTWVATASEAGLAHLVPLSFAWDGARVILAAESRALTIRNLEATTRARLGFGHTRDVVLMDVVLDHVVDVTGVPDGVAEAYARQSGWDPRRESAPYAFVFLRPTRIQAWREANELDGRLLMKDGVWVV